MEQKKSYIPLARKYRPQKLVDVRGQEVLVKTISNAIIANRIANSYMLTGIRGIGKTTTARIIAKTVNCTNIEVIDNLVSPCGNCINCKAFQLGKHPDVIEIDAASKTGVADIREVIENSNYLPQIGKYKIYVIDEIHMLSINAFNALLKTLEEPPKHLIFIFATTEVRKIPLTILSRCQRFDLKRLSNEKIAEHLQKILEIENKQAEEDVLKIIAKLSGGSVRDSLFLLEQAINFAANEKLLASDISKIFYLSSNEDVIKLFEMIIQGKAEDALGHLRDCYYNGIDPLILISDILEIINIISKSIACNNLVENDVFIDNNHIKKLKEFTNSLQISYLTTIWQIIYNDIGNIKESFNIFSSIEMLIIKLCYLADKPMPNELIEQNNDIIKPTEEQLTSYLSNEIVKAKEVLCLNEDNIALKETNYAKINNFDELVELFHKHNEMILYHHLYEDVSLVKFEPRIIKLKVINEVPHNFSNLVANFLLAKTGIKWVVTITNEDGNPTLNQKENDILEQEKKEIAEKDIVKEVMQQFQGAKITSIVKN